MNSPGNSQIFENRYASRDCFRNQGSASLPAPEFRVSGNFMFYATLKNKNWGKENASWMVTEDVAGHDAGHDGAHYMAHDGAHDRTHDDFKKLVEFCSIPRSRQEMMDYINYSSRRHFADRYLKQLLDSGRIRMTILKLFLALNPKNARL